jgi:hypothetical protein
VEQLVPMEEFDEAAVQRWLGTVLGLTAAQLAAARMEMVEDEYDGPVLVAATAKTLRRLLKGSDAEEAVLPLLATRDAYLAAERAAAAVVEAAEAERASEAAAAEQPGCSICLEPYSAVGGIVPRVLRCGHDFCEACLDLMLAPVPPARKRRKRLECPTCRQECTLRSGRASELPTVYGLQGV